MKIFTFWTSSRFSSFKSQTCSRNFGQFDHHPHPHPPLVTETICWLNLLTSTFLHVKIAMIDVKKVVQGLVGFFVFFSELASVNCMVAVTFGKRIGGERRRRQSFSVGARCTFVDHLWRHRFCQRESMTFLRNNRKAGTVFSWNKGARDSFYWEFSWQTMVNRR